MTGDCQVKHGGEVFVKTASRWFPEPESFVVGIWNVGAIDTKCWCPKSRGKDMSLTAFSNGSVHRQAMAGEREPTGALDPSAPLPHEGSPLLLSHAGSKKESARFYNPDWLPCSA